MNPKNPMTRFFVRAPGSRPDYRLVLAFVWGDADCDTDGNSYNPASREWTALYARHRGRPLEAFDVNLSSTDPLVLEVESQHEWIAAAIAYLLAVSTTGGVSAAPSGPFGSAETLLPRISGFDVEDAWARYQSSRFQRATLDDPYPTPMR